MTSTEKQIVRELLLDVLKAHRDGHLQPTDMAGAEILNRMRDLHHELNKVEPIGKPN